MEFLKY